MLIKLPGKNKCLLINTKEKNKELPENLKLSKNKSLLLLKFWLKKSLPNQKLSTSLSNFLSDKELLLNQQSWIRTLKPFLNMSMDKMRLLKEDLFSSTLNKVMRRLRNPSMFQEIKSITTLIFNHKSIPFTKKLMWMNLKFKRKNYNQSSKELNKNLELLKETSTFQEPTFIINQFFNLLLIERTSNWTLLMEKSNTMRVLQEYFQPNSTKLLEFKKNKFQDHPFTNNTPSNQNWPLRIWKLTITDNNQDTEPPLSDTTPQWLTLLLKLSVKIELSKSLLLKMLE